MNLYMDDLLIWNKNPFILSIQVKAVLDRLKEFKCQVNWEKSILIPTQSIEYLGIILNTRKENLQLEITKQKWKSIKNQCKLKNVHSPKHLASIIGTLNFYRIVTPDLRLVMRPLERWLTAELRANKGNYKAKLLFPPFQESLRAVELIKTLKRKQVISEPIDPKLTLQIEVDSSPTGWGATAQRPNQHPLETRAYWNAEERLMSVNWRELQAAIQAIQILAKPGESVSLIQDSSTAISYWRNIGGKIPKLSRLVEKALRIMREKEITLNRIDWRPSDPTWTPDVLSRMKDESDWTLNKKVFYFLTSKWGTPSVDLFATHLNHQVPLYCSPYPDQNALQTDAFHLHWGLFPLVYANPPFRLLPRILQKIQEEKANIMLIAPRWDTPWKPRLLELASEITPLRRSPNLFFSGHLQAYQNPAKFNTDAYLIIMNRQLYQQL